MLAATIAAASGPAAAAANCGTISFSFEGTRLINDGISHRAGPFTINLPAGNYDVVLRSSDTHSEQTDQVDQEAERWWFELDSGWQSVATTDLPDELDANMTLLMAQEIPASSSITLHHLGQGGVNSINPLCVGFTSVDENPDTPDDPGDPGDDPDGDPNDPNDPGRVPGDPGDPDDDPDRAIPDPGDPGDPGDDPGRVPTDPVVPELAITGAGTLTIRLIGLAVILLHVGFLFQVADRQRRRV